MFFNPEDIRWFKPVTLPKPSPHPNSHPNPNPTPTPTPTPNPSPNPGPNQVELTTKFGRKGHIKESLGTHGCMKRMLPHLPYISRTSPVHLPHISRASPRHARLHEVHVRQAGAAARHGVHEPVQAPVPQVGLLQPRAPPGSLGRHSAPYSRVRDMFGCVGPWCQQQGWWVPYSMLCPSCVCGRIKIRNYSVSA